MKQKFNFVLMILVTATLMVSCKKDRTVVYVNQNNGNNSKPIKSERLNTASFFSDFAPKSQKTTLDATKTMMITSNSGNQYVLPANCLLHQNNTPVTGNVEFVLIEYRTKSDMLTSGVTTTSGKELLASGSMFYMTAYQNQEELKIKDNTSIGLYLNPNSSDNSPMDYWVGSKNNNDSNNKIDWTMTSPIQVRPRLDTVNMKRRYNFSLPEYKFGYSNLDCLHSNTTPRCKSWSFEPPKSCNDTNSVGMIVMNQYNACGYVYWVKQGDLMSTQYALPIGETFKLLLYRKTGTGEDDIEYVILNEEVKENTVISYNGVMTKITKAGLKSIIDGL
ncbi:MAG TPA: hypothetical protein VGF79_04960 [Bacteroidia bacterium]